MAWTIPFRTPGRVSAVLLCSSVLAAAQVTPGAVAGAQKISETQGGFTGELEESESFGCALAALGDVNGDGYADLAVGAFADNDGGAAGEIAYGAVWILFLGPGGTVLAQQKISQTEGWAGADLHHFSAFGGSLAALGDVSGDGIPDLAVGAYGDNGQGLGRGAVYLLMLDTDGTVKSHVKLGDAQGGFTGQLDDGDSFGSSVALLGDCDGDGIHDLAVGAQEDSDGGSRRGAVWILFLQADGTVRTQTKISDVEGGFTGVLANVDNFGSAVEPLGDFDGDGTLDLAVGAMHGEFSISGGGKPGKLWLLYLNADGSVKEHREITGGVGGLTLPIEPSGMFGEDVANLGDIDGDDVVDLAVGSPRTGALDPPVHGSYFVLFLRDDGTVKTALEVTEGTAGFAGPIGTTSYFGWSVEALGDVDGDLVRDLAVGAVLDDDGGEPLFANQGAVWILYQDGWPPAHTHLYGCGVNPPGSLSVLSGSAEPGGALVVGVDNPLGTQSPGSATFVYVSLNPAPGFPCGVLYPGIGMSAPGAAGEILIDLTHVIAIVPGPPWAGPGTPAPVALPVPENPALLGITCFKQGLIVDPSAGAGVPFAITEARLVFVGV